MIMYTFSTISYENQIPEHIQQQITNILILRLSYSTKTPTKIVHGSVAYGGMGIKNIYIKQGIAKKSYSDTSNLIEIWQKLFYST